ncbi:MAG: hypothetical protein HYR56_22940 [Acidobacteria bacterium]|nr:hypothetical protein [Acidobacteriota bacterium]MBI3423910.1 hypothetical protein [Acidobacteriota bacterium]
MEWRVFFIGPMGKEKPGKGADKGVDYTLHLPKLHAFLVSYLKEEHGYQETKNKFFTLTEGQRVGSVTLVKGKGKGKDSITILTPFDLYGAGDIPSNVFDAIDDSDLVIADLSGNKPAVIYELAFTHALGIETILVGGAEAVSFYLAQTKFINIDFRPKTISSDELKNRFASWLKNRNKLFESENPLQRFYGAPLPDISAANGLAAGFYDNFARPILTNGEIVYRTQTPEGKLVEETRALQGLIVLRPENLASRVEEIREELEKRLLAEFPGEVLYGAPDKLFIRTNEGARTPFFLVRDYLIDIPRTMFSLALSPRLERTNRNQTLKSSMEGVLIGRFFEGVKKNLKKDRNIKVKLFHFGSVAEIPAIIKTGGSNTWS